jgi:DNA-binding transcriptional ArsR family regulator
VGDLDLRILERQAEICKALGNVKRLQIIYLLKEGAMTAGEIAAALETTPANASQHLHAMRQAGILESNRQGSNIYYRVADESVLEALGMVRMVLREQLRRERAILYRSLAAPEPELSRR